MPTVILNWTCKPSVRDKFLPQFPEILAATCAYDGCISDEVLVDQDNSNKFAVYQKWSTRVAYEKYLSWRVENGMAEISEPIIAVPIEILHFDAQ